MNAVERLLAQGEQVLSLFDELFIDRLGSGRPADLPDVPPGLLYAVGHSVIDAMPAGQYWASGHWLQAAAEASWHELKEAKKNPCRETVAARTADLFREYLAQREQLLSESTWRRLLADVVFESRGWEPHATRVVSLAETVAEQVRHIEQVPGDIEPLEWERQERTGLRQALDRLHPYSQPPKPAGSTFEKQTGGKQKKRRDRKGIGGPKAKFPLEFIREMVDARKRDERHFAKARRPLPRISEWLSDYFTNVKKLPLSTTLPPKDAKKPEEWSIRANRFWKAANTRLSRYLAEQSP